MQYTGAFGEGARGGSSVMANQLSFGGTDRIGWTESQQYQGADYDATRVFGTISREVGLTALTLGSAQLARGEFMEHAMPP